MKHIIVNSQMLESKIATITTEETVGKEILANLNMKTKKAVQHQPVGMDSGADILPVVYADFPILESEFRSQSIKSKSGHHLVDFQRTV